MLLKIFVVVIPKEGLVGEAPPILLWRDKYTLLVGPRSPILLWLWQRQRSEGTFSCDTAHRVFPCYTQLSPSHMKHTRSQLDSANVGTAYLWVTAAIINCVLSTFFKCFQNSPILLDNSGDSENGLLLHKRKVSKWLRSRNCILHAVSKSVVHSKRKANFVHCSFFSVWKLPAH